ncbi:hypothetical protein [Frankia sp. Cppng1_Ct_nod]|uniref:hypothetical protein n=1 Tax=Frankia sp. Cppng1_Ct_nod TaxID=2897162 RepID=UPI0010419131|nr:hypothetical protein [Frankia sp. Cppng1_Ct_nod]
MTRRGATWGAGVGVILGAVSGVLTGELAGGWPWWVADAVVVLGSVLLAMWLASGDGSPERLRVDRGGLFAGRNITIGGSANLRAPSSGTPEPPPDGPDADRIVGPGAMAAGRDLTIGGDLNTDVGGAPPAQR